MIFGVGQVLYGGLQRQFITNSPQASNAAGGNVGKVRVMAERLTAMYVGEMDFNEGYANGEQGIPQCHAGVGEGGRIEQDEIHAFVACFMDTLNQLVFRIALQLQEMMAGIAAVLVEPGIDVRQRICSVDARFPAAKQVEIRAVQYKYCCHEKTIQVLLFWQHFLRNL